MNEKVKRVMEYIHGIAYRELQGDWPEPVDDE